MNQPNKENWIVTNMRKSSKKIKYRLKRTQRCRKIALLKLWAYFKVQRKKANARCDRAGEATAKAASCW